MNLILSHLFLWSIFLLSGVVSAQQIIVKTDPAYKRLLKSSNNFSDPFSEQWMQFQSVTDSFIVFSSPDQVATIPSNQVIGSNKEILFKINAQFWNDSLHSEQWNLRMVGFNNLNASDVPVTPVTVAIIDTGIEPDHPDLTNQLWKNDSDPIDGIDNDGNGLVDDYHGFDFTGLKKNFQPDDDQGHGTSVAGIIAAEGNNEEGITGLAQHSRILALKAFDETGNGTELNVAKALLYAWYRKAGTVNMSFGINNEKSLLIESIVRAMTADGIILVASSGNRGGFDRHYPSAYEGVISVGAATEYGSRAFFSQFGNRLDILAPGVNIPTTQTGKSYGLFSGTSAAAPHVTALASWLKALNPQIQPEEFRVHLQTTATKTNREGFSSPDGAGIVNFNDAIKQSGQSGTVRILQPASDSWIANNPVSVKISAASPNFESWQLFLQTNPGYPDEWILLSEGTSQLLDSSVTTFNPLAYQSKDSLWSLRLRVNTKTGAAIEDRRFIFRKTKPNSILDTLFYRGYSGADPVIGIELRTANPSAVTLSDGSNSASNHTWRHLTVAQLPVFSESEQIMSAIVTDLSGDSLAFSRRIPATKPINFKSFFPDSQQISSMMPGFIHPETPDMNGDGMNDYIISRESESSEYGPVYFFSGEQATNPSDSIPDLILVPKDVVFFNGNWFFLAISLGRTYLYQSSDSISFPTNLIFSSEAGKEMWSACLDTTGETLAIIWRDSRGYYRSRVNKEAGTVELVQTFDFPENYQISGPPRVIPLHFSDKNETDYFLSDQNGNLLVFRQTNESIIPLIFADPLPLYLSSDYIAATDLTGDGREEVLILSRDLTISDPVFDETWPGRWNFRIYSAHSGQPELLDDRWLTGYQPTAKDRSSLHAFGTTVSISVDPHLYFINYKQSYPLQYEDAALITGSPASAAGVTNTQRYWTNSNGILTIWSHQPEELPVISNFTQTSDTSGFFSLAKTYQKIYYKIFENGFSKFDSLFNSSILPVSGKSALTIQLFTESGNQKVREGINQKSVQFYKEGSVTAGYQNGWIRIHGTNPLATQFTLQDSLWDWQGQSPMYWMPGGNHHEFWVRYSDHLSGLWKIPALKDKNGRLMNPETSFLLIPSVQDQKKTFYVTGLAVESRRKALITFNRAINQESLSLVQDLNPQVTLSVENPSSVAVLAKSQPFGNVGNTVIIDLGKLKSAAGDTLDTRTRFVDLSTFSESVKDLIVYPNPWNASQSGVITFGGLPGESIITIYSSTLEVVAILTSGRGTNSLIWDGKSQNGKRLGSGIYIYHVTGPDGKKRTGKFALVR